MNRNRGPHAPRSRSSAEFGEPYAILAQAVAFFDIGSSYLSAFKFDQVTHCNQVVKRQFSTKCPPG
jgi:hypothetical protein